MKRLAAGLLLVASLIGVASAQPETAAAPTPAAKAPDDPIAKYFTELEASKLIDVESGNLETLRKELGAAEELIRGGNFVNAAVARV